MNRNLFYNQSDDLKKDRIRWGASPQTAAHVCFQARCLCIQPVALLTAPAPAWLFLLIHGGAGGAVARKKTRENLRKSCDKQRRSCADCWVSGSCQESSAPPDLNSGMRGPKCVYSLCFPPPEFLGNNRKHFLSRPDPESDSSLFLQPAALFMVPF